MTASLRVILHVPWDLEVQCLPSTLNQPITQPPIAFQVDIRYDWYLKSVNLAIEPLDTDVPKVSSERVTAEHDCLAFDLYLLLGKSDLVDLVGTGDFIGKLGAEDAPFWVESPQEFESDLLLLVESLNLFEFVLEDFLDDAAKQRAMGAGLVVFGHLCNLGNVMAHKEEGAMRGEGFNHDTVITVYQPISLKKAFQGFLKLWALQTDFVDVEVVALVTLVNLNCGILPLLLRFEHARQKGGGTSILFNVVGGIRIGIRSIGLVMEDLDSVRVVSLRLATRRCTPGHRDGLPGLCF